MGMAKGVYKKIYTGEVTCATTDSTITTIATVTVDGAYRSDKLLFFRLRDKAGKRNGYFYGTDCICAKGTVLGHLVYKGENDDIKCYATTSGIYMRGVNANGTITIASRYVELYTSIIDGTYLFEVYTLDWPDNVSPF